MGPSYRVNTITGSALGSPTFYAEQTALYLQNKTSILSSPGGDFGAWEKLPADIRANLSSPTLNTLAKFPADWPEIEFLSIGGHLGYQENTSQQPGDGFMYTSVAVALQMPMSRGTVDIRSADTRDKPVIDPRWLTHPVDVEVALAAYRRVRNIMRLDVMHNVVIGGEYFPGEADTQTDEQLLQLIRKSVSTVFHASCTCAMGKDGDPMAVLDSRARVRGVKGLRVVDASAFPLLPPGHPVATVCECLMPLVTPTTL
jgi:choline dehydrogenase